jgi:hypothetical protein
LGLRPERFPIKWTRLHDGPVGQPIGCHVDFMLGEIDKRHVDVFKILARRIVNDRRGISATRRERGEQEASRDAGAGREAWHQSKPHQVKESKNEKRQKSADYCVKKSLFSNHHGSTACAGIEFKTI